MDRKREREFAGVWIEVIKVPKKRMCATEEDVLQENLLRRYLLWVQFASSVSYTRCTTRCQKVVWNWKSEGAKFRRLKSSMKFNLNKWNRSGERENIESASVSDYLGVLSTLCLQQRGNLISTDWFSKAIRWISGLCLCDTQSAVRISGAFLDITRENGDLVVRLLCIEALEMIVIVLVLKSGPFPHQLFGRPWSSLSALLNALSIERLDDLGTIILSLSPEGWADVLEFVL